MALIDTVKAQYPTPRSVHDAVDSDIDYCVGGALCLAHTELWEPRESPYGVSHFPSPAALTTMLLKINPALTRTDAGIWAGAIISANDLGHFEDAWERAGQALAHQREATHA